MTESAFADQPWLVERNGRFLQVTEMLYRVAELADGTRSVLEIARVLSTTLGVEVSDEYVRRLLESKLIPVGIIAADSTAQARPSVSPATSAAPRSALALQMRMALVSPRLVDPATRVLQYLFVPPVLLLVLFVTVQAQFWLFFVHGLAGSVYEGFNTPAAVPLAFALLIASAAFHEVGHAAALRYGGGRARSMGVGLFLMYPAFYTDVTDNYRLGRWARVRTDLGGFYFNLVFSLALMGVYHATGLEFLLLVAVLIDLDIAHQCLPFVRLDGYWALADLTGIPDFFSLMGAYLRSVIPVRRWTGRKLPRLKWWAKAVFALYIGLALPVIGLLLFAMLNTTPRVLMNAWDAGQRQLAEVARSQANGDVVAVASAEAQLFLLLLPAFGLSLMLFNLSRTLAHGLWLWGRPSPARRLVASVVAASAAAFVVFLWVPDLRPTVNARVRDWVHPQGEVVAPMEEVTESAAPAPTSATPSPGVTATPSSTAASTATPTASSTATPTASSTATPAVTATATPTDATLAVEPTATLRPTRPPTLAPAVDSAPVQALAKPAPATALAPVPPSQANGSPSGRVGSTPTRASRPLPPTPEPTQAPAAEPTEAPTPEPTETPTPRTAQSPTPRTTDTPFARAQPIAQQATPWAPAPTPAPSPTSPTAASPPTATTASSPPAATTTSSPPAATTVAPAPAPNQTVPGAARPSASPSPARP
jgi:putative peptide zinc metalloprotease protein